jgi:serine/threonine protein kinase
MANAPHFFTQFELASGREKGRLTFPPEFLRRAPPWCSGNQMVGTATGIYRIIASLGAGGSGEVFRARDTKLGQDVAFKILPEVLMKPMEQPRPR